MPLQLAPARRMEKRRACQQLLSKSVSGFVGALVGPLVGAPRGPGAGPGTRGQSNRTNQNAARSRSLFSASLGPRLCGTVRPLGHSRSRALPTHGPRIRFATEALPNQIAAPSIFGFFGAEAAPAGHSLPPGAPSRSLPTLHGPASPLPQPPEALPSADRQRIAGTQREPHRRRGPRPARAGRGGPWRAARTPPGRSAARVRAGGPRPRTARLPPTPPPSRRLCPPAARRERGRPRHLVPVPLGVDDDERDDADSAHYGHIGSQMTRDMPSSQRFMYPNASLGRHLPSR